jgi:hypothetical protein
MNRKQLAVLWTMAILLSAASVVHGLEDESLFHVFVLPVLLIGIVLLLQVADRPTGERASVDRKALAVAAVVVGGLLSYQVRALQGLDSSIASVENSVGETDAAVSAVQQSVDDLDRSVDALATAVALLPRR